MSFAALRVAAVAVSLAFDVFAVSIGVGASGVSLRARFRIGLSFACAEVGMTLVGVGLGAAAGRLIGAVAAYVGYGVLIVVGAYIVYESRRSAARFDLSRGWGLVLASLSTSMDSLGIGFSIVYLGAPLYVAIVAIAVASVLATTIGLAFGQALGARAGQRAGFFAGAILAATGAVFAVLKLLGKM